MKKILIVLLAGLLILTACAPSQPATPAGPNVETMVASTLQALTAAAPSPTAQTSGLPVLFNNISFKIPLELNASASPSTNTDVEFPYVNPSNGPMPEHVVFQFTNYPVQGEAKIMVFKSSEYAAYGEQKVVTALLAKQDAAQPLPDALLYSKIYALAKPVTFQNGHGIRYVIKPDTAIAPITNQDIFYYFIGVTNDGAYFVSVIFHVNTSFLVADSNKDSPTPPDGVPFNWGADLDFAKYKADIIQKLNDTPAEKYTPSLILLDKMIESIQVTNP